jgi:CO dehydrogenase/acetyl-CoA synthase epsilon subunit
MFLLEKAVYIYLTATTQCNLIGSEMTSNTTAVHTENNIGKYTTSEYLRGFDAGYEHAFNFVLEYLEEVPSGLGLEGLIKKIQQRNGKTS